MTVGADPERLARFQRAGVRRGGELDRVGRRLDHWAPSTVVAASLGPAGLVAAAVAPAPDADRVARARVELAVLARDVHRTADRERTLGRWVGAVGTALAGADHGRLADATVTDLARVSARPGHRRDDVRTIVDLVARDADPAIVAATAVALGPDRLAAVARVRPDLVGPTDGLPVTARYEANRVLLERARRAAVDPDRRATLGALLADDPATGRPRQILDFDPDGDGRVVEVLGDLDTARHVAVTVPGMGTDIDNFDRTVRGDIAALATTAGRADRHTAVVAWLGYDPPDGFVADLDELGAAVGTERARRGGRDLARFVAGLGRHRDRDLTLVGHSYGTTTVAAALLDGAAPDRVVMMGSPGVLVDRAADFGLPHTAFFTMAARRDPIADLGWFGATPNRRGSGFTPLPVDGTGHRAYLVPGSAASREVADVIVGRRPGR